MSNSRKKLITKIIAHTILILGAVIMLVPFFWMLSSSFKTLGEVFVFPPTLFGERLVWENYTQISSRFDYFAYFLNSIKVSAWVVFFQVFTSATAGYVFAKINFRIRILFSPALLYHFIYVSLNTALKYFCQNEFQGPG